MLYPSVIRLARSIRPRFGHGEVLLVLLPQARPVIAFQQLL